MIPITPIQPIPPAPRKTAVFTLKTKKNQKKCVFFRFGYWHFEKNGYNIV